MMGWGGVGWGGVGWADNVQRRSTEPTVMAVRHTMAMALGKQCLCQSEPFDCRDSSSEHAVKELQKKKKRKVQIFGCFPVAKRKSIKKLGILKQPLSTPGIHKSMQIPVKNDEKIKHNGIYHIL